MFTTMLPKSWAHLLALAASVQALPTRNAKEPVPSLSWGPCELPGFNYSLVTSPIQCIKYAVPLDYTNPESEQLDLQLIKVNATKEPFLGSVLFNPGGPGSSGVEDVAQKGHIYSE